MNTLDKDSNPATKANENGNSGEEMPNGVDAVDEGEEKSNGFSSYLGYSLSFTGAARAAMKLADVAAKHGFTIAQKATETGVDMGKNGLEVAAEAMRNGVKGVGQMTATRLSQASQNENWALETRTSLARAADHVQTASGAIDQGIHHGSSLLSAGMGVGKIIAVKGIDIGRFFTATSLQVAQSGVEHIDSLVVSSLEQSGVDVNLLRNHCSFIAANEFIDLIMEFSGRVNNIGILEIRKALLALGFLQEILKSPYPNPSQYLNASYQLDMEQLHNQRLRAKLGEIFKYCMAIYGPKFLDALGYQNSAQSAEELFFLLSNIPSDDILKSDWVSHTSRPAYVVLLDHSKRRLVLVLRGSSSLRDFLTDFKCKDADFEGSKAHSGMLKSAEWFHSNLDTLFRKTLLQYHDYDLLLCGHSLGGGVVSLLCHILRRDEFYRRHNIHAFSFGAPCVVSADLSFQATEYITSIVLGPDLVCRLSLATVENLLSKIQALSERSPNEQQSNSSSSNSIPYVPEMDDNEPEITTKKILQLIENYETCGDSHFKATYERKLRDIMLNLRSVTTFEPLLPSGRVILIIPKSDLQPQPPLSTEGNVDSKSTHTEADNTDDRMESDDVNILAESSNSCMAKVSNATSDRDMEMSSKSDDSVSGGRKNEYVEEKTFVSSPVDALGLPNKALNEEVATLRHKNETGTNAQINSLSSAAQSLSFCTENERSKKKRKLSVDEMNIEDDNKAEIVEDGVFGDHSFIDMKGNFLDLGEIVLHKDLLTQHLPSAYAKVLGIHPIRKPEI